MGVDLCALEYTPSYFKFINMGTFALNYMSFEQCKSSRIHPFHKNELTLKLSSLTPRNSTIVLSSYVSHDDL